MGVRVRVRIKYGGSLLETVALVNTGFETPNPQILLPVKAAEKLGIWPNLPRDASIEIYDTAGGPTRVYRVRNAVTVEVAGREGRSVVADVVISHLEVEVLISDKLTEELMIAIEKPSEGIWRFRDEMVERKSEKPEIWL
ncbi:MAG: retropepsin-like domain-containing protein [archaeon YNP-LCB-024-027]|nr:retropepsin-like domain-containing protein [Candidatus Culexarchaeum yellowstonense]